MIYGNMRVMPTRSAGLHINFGEGPNDKTQDKLDRQTLQDGERFFELEAAEVHRQEARAVRNRRLQALAKRYRRPASYTGVAILVAVIAMLARGQISPLSGTGISTAILGIQQRAIELWQKFSI